MTEAARGYLVRDADSTRGTGAKVDQIYPYTLRGLTEALEEARFRSHSGAPQVLAILGTGNTRVIRRFENGREVPVAPLAARLAVWIYRRSRLRLQPVAQLATLVGEHLRLDPHEARPRAPVRSDAVDHDGMAEDHVPRLAR